MIVWPWRAYPFFWCGGNRCFAYLNIIAWTCTDKRWQRKELPWKSFSFLDNFALKVGLSLNSWRFFNFYNNNRFCPTPKCRCLLRPVVSTRSSIADIFSIAVFRLWRAACSDLGLFLSSAVKKKKQKKDKSQSTWTLNFQWSKQQFLVFYLSPLLIWNDGQRISWPIMACHSIVRKNRCN